jgi:hypothetical protein
MLLLENNNQFKERRHLKRDHARFPIYSDQELGFTTKVFANNLLDSVSLICNVIDLDCR